MDGLQTFPPAVLADSTPAPASSRREKNGDQGTAEWAGNRCRFRLARGVDKSRKWRQLSDFVAMLHEPIATTKEAALDQGRRVANLMSQKMKDERAKPTAQRSAGLIGDTWFQLWREDRERAGIDTTSDVTHYRKYIQPVIGPMPIVEVTRREIEAIVATLDELIRQREVEGGKAGIAWKTADNVWTTLRAMFRDAAFSKPSRGLVVRADNPTADVQPPERGEDRERTFLYPSEYLALMTSAALWNGTGRNVLVGRHYRRWARVFTLATYLCMRASELRGVRWEHVDFEHRTITVRVQAKRGKRKAEDTSTKTAIVRTFEIPLALMPLLRVMREEAGGDKATGRFVDMPPASELATMLKRYCKLAGLTRQAIYADTLQEAPLTFHDLRATGITWHARQPNVDPFWIQQKAGHRNMDMTMAYIRKVQALPAEFGQPFPAVPAVVLGALDAVAGPATSGGPTGTGEQPVQAGPNPDQETHSEAKITANRTARSGPHNDRPGETCRILTGPGPSGPTDSTERDGSNTVAGPATDPVVASIRRALDAALAAGNLTAAAALATALAEELGRPSGKVVPLRRLA